MLQNVAGQGTVVLLMYISIVCKPVEGTAPSGNAAVLEALGSVMTFIVRWKDH